MRPFQGFTQSKIEKAILNQRLRKQNEGNDKPRTEVPANSYDILRVLGNAMTPKRTSKKVADLSQIQYR